MNESTALALISDLERILSDDTAEVSVVEVAETSVEESLQEAAKGDRRAPADKPEKVLSGTELEKKAREKRKARAKDKSGGGSHHPFKTKTKLGPGPRGGRLNKRGKWKCSCPVPYKCNCVGKGGVKKTIRLKRSYKLTYDKEYKKFRKGQKQ